MRWSPRATRRLALSAGILLLASGLRTWRLAEVPPGLHHDEAFHLLRAAEITRAEVFPVYIPDNQGNEPLFAYLAAVALSIVGPANWAGRLAASWVGLLAVALTLRAGHEMFPRRSVGTWAGLLLAGLFWHLDMSRWGSQPILTAAAAAGTVAGLWHGARTGRKLSFVLAGGSLAAGLWAYVVFRVFPLAALAAGLGLLAAWPRRRRRLLLGGTLAGLTALALYAPLGLWFIRNPGWFFNRFDQVTQTTLGAEAPTRALLRQARLVLEGLVIPGQGDHDWRHNLPGRPGLDPVQAGLVGLGIVVGVRQRCRPAGYVLLAWVAIGLAPAVLTEHPPQHGRSVMATPALAILGGLGADLLWRWGHNRTWARAGLAAAVAASAGLAAYAYFVTWSTDPHLFTAFDAGLYELAGALREAPESAVLYETPVYREYPTLEYALGPGAYAHFKAFNGRACTLLPAATTDETWFGIVTAEDTTTLPALQTAYPLGRLVDTLVQDGAPYAAVFAVAPGQPVVLTPGTARAAEFGGLIDLLGYSAEPSMAAGSRILLTLYWRMAQPTAADLHQFVHLLGAPQPDGNPLYAQRDTGPCDNSYPTWQWSPGEVLVDRVEVAVPDATPSGTYQLNVGWYDSATLARLEATDAAAQPLGDFVTLQTIEVLPSGQ